MKRTYKLIAFIGMLTLLLTSCQQDEYGPRKESMPVFEGVALNPTTLTFGDSVMLTATIKDPKVNLASLAYEITSEGKTLATGTVPLTGNEQSVNHPIYIALISGQSDNAAVQVKLTAFNMLKNLAKHEISGISGKRPVYQQLYLVTNNGAVETLQAKSDGKFENDNLNLPPSFRFKIAEKLHADKSIDFSGDVYGNVNGKLAPIDASGESAFMQLTNGDYVKTFSFDSKSFQASMTGSGGDSEGFVLSAFEYVDVSGEVCYTHKRNLEKGKTYATFGKLADVQAVYNLDFFERVSAGKVKFLGETGEYTLYFNPVRKVMIVGVEKPSYPNYLVVCGTGLGYPTRISSEAIAAVYPGRQRTHTSWGFGHVLQYMLMRRLSENVYQGTFYTPADSDRNAGFKPFENTAWSKEKKANMFTFTGEKIISGDNNWNIKPEAVSEPGVYRFTVDLNTNTVHVEKVTL